LTNARFEPINKPQPNYLPQCNLCEGLWPSELHAYARRCVCVCVRVGVCVCMRVRVWMRCVRACMCIRVCTYVCACVVYLCMCMCVRAYVRVCLRACVRAGSCLRAHTLCVHAHVKGLKAPFLLVLFLPKRGSASQAICPPWGP
jgi:hypothetical protein